MIRVLICDDQWLVCEGLEAILSADPEITVVGVTHDGAEAVESIPKTSPDVVLMDLRMPGMNGIQATRQITARYPDIKVLVLTTYSADEWVLDAVRSGAAGYLLKGTSRDALIAAIKGTYAGLTHVDPAVAGKLFERIVQEPHVPAAASTIVDQLSEREREILRLIARGSSNEEIARLLFLSKGTVRNYVSAILGKLGVSDRTQAAVLAIKYGLGQ